MKNILIERIIREILLEYSKKDICRLNYLARKQKRNIKLALKMYSYSTK
jgi:hypothetical protein